MPPDLTRRNLLLAAASAPVLARYSLAVLPAPRARH